MTKYLALTIIGTISISSTANAVTVGFSQYDYSIYGSGLFENNTNVNIHFITGNVFSGLTPETPSAISIDLGTYLFNDRLTVAPFEIFLSRSFHASLRDGVDEYLSLYLQSEDQNITLSITRLESEWFGTPTDLIGQDVPAPTFVINELRLNLYGNSPFETLRVDYLDLGVNFEGVVPEPATGGLLMGSLALGLTLTRRRRKTR